MLSGFLICTQRVLITIPYRTHNKGVRLGVGYEGRGNKLECAVNSLLIVDCVILKNDTFPKLPKVKKPSSNTAMVGHQSKVISVYITQEINYLS